MPFGNVSIIKNFSFFNIPVAICFLFIHWPVFGGCRENFKIVFWFRIFGGLSSIVCLQNTETVIQLWPLRSARASRMSNEDDLPRGFSDPNFYYFLQRDDDEGERVS